MASLDALLDRFRRAPERAAVLVDFDGTLSPIVLDAASAVALPSARTVLVALRERFGLVAVVSGRPVSFLADRLPAGLVLCGLYGLERVVDGEVRVHPAAPEWQTVIDEVADLATTEAPDEVEVEHKGLSLTLHFRRHPKAGEAVRAWADGVAISTGLHVRPAKMSIELHPPVNIDKGTVVEELAAGLDAVCFVGDDAGDLPAFDALDRLEAKGATVLRVAVTTSETAAELRDRADHHVSGPDGAVAFLRELLA